eukprot:364548-Chlamydomonas_euryale.AAC.2
MVDGEHNTLVAEWLVVRTAHVAEKTLLHCACVEAIQQGIEHLKRHQQSKPNKTAACRRRDGGGVRRRSDQRCGERPRKLCGACDAADGARQRRAVDGDGGTAAAAAAAIRDGAKQSNPSHPARCSSSCPRPSCRFSPLPGGGR